MLAWPEQSIWLDMLEADVDRSIYDLNWNAPLPKGGEALGKNVTLAVHLEFVRQEA